MERYGRLMHALQIGSIAHAQFRGRTHARNARAGAHASDGERDRDGGADDLDSLSTVDPRRRNRGERDDWQRGPPLAPADTFATLALIAAQQYRSRVLRPFLLLRSAIVGGSAWLLAATLVVACSDDTVAGAPPGSAADAGIDRARLPAPLHPAASCDVTIDTPELLAGTHVPEGTAITYSSNPPSSGPHYPVWANFQEYAAPVDDGYLVHSLEHGAVLLLYKCEDGASCADTVEALRKVRDAIPSDKRCDPDIRVRVVIAPYPKLDVPVAAVAWGWTYKAACVDLPTLTQFANEHYAQGTEDLCAPGRTF
ncbi:MAG: hypothetical protein JWP97_5999 [Labilithrix sp.]|nr:hypothetical protein [Labilithrix sp.]